MENNFWTIGKVIKGKFLFVALWTYALSMGMIVGLDATITYILNKQNPTFGTNLYSFLPYSLILIVPAFALAAFIMQKYCQWKFSKKDQNDPRVMRQMEHEASFKWSAVYSFLIGYALLFFWLYVFVNMQQYLIGLAGLFIVPFLIMKPLNKWMIKKTKTNATLIEDLASGVYGDIPEKYMTIDMLAGIIDALENGMASSVWGAIIVHKSMNIIKGIGKFLLKAGVVGTILLIIFSMGATTGIEEGFKDQVSYMKNERRKQELANQLVGALEANGYKVKSVRVK